MITGIYLEKRSWLHRIPAGLKLLLLCLLSIVMMLERGLILPAATAVFSWLVYVSLGRQAATTALRPLKPVLLLIVMMALLQALTAGPVNALRLLLQMQSMVLLAQLITLTTRTQDMVAALMTVMSPLKVTGMPVHKLAFSFSLMIRFIPVLAALFLQLSRSWDSRQGRTGQKWRLIIPMMIQTIRTSEQVSEALHARGGLQQHRK